MLVLFNLYPPESFVVLKGSGAFLWIELLDKKLPHPEDETTI